MKGRAAVLLSATIIAVDQLTKQLFSYGRLNTEWFDAIPLPPVPLYVVLLLIWLSVLVWMDSSRVGTALLIGGATGNLIDHVRLGGVRDWLEVPRVTVLNVADLALWLGFAIVVVQVLRNRKEVAACESTRESRSP